jgi:hypothetical protein
MSSYEGLLLTVKFYKKSNQECKIKISLYMKNEGNEYESYTRT